MFLYGQTQLNQKAMGVVREAIPKEKSQNCGPFPYGGGEAQPHSVAFGGVFPNITEAILVDEFTPQK